MLACVTSQASTHYSCAKSRKSSASTVCLKNSSATSWPKLHVRRASPALCSSSYLERRLDNAVYRAGFASSRRAARQLVTHGHFMLNGRRVDIPSIRMRIGDEITLREHSKATEYFKKLDDVSPAPSTIPGWLKVDRKKTTVTVTNLPLRDDAEPEINEQLIVEYYSR